MPPVKKVGRTKKLVCLYSFMMFFSLELICSTDIERCHRTARFSYSALIDQFTGHNLFNVATCLSIYEVWR